jgi:hypothetical protein
MPLTSNAHLFILAGLVLFLFLVVVDLDDE